MLPVQPRYRPTVGQLARTHAFRFVTMIATWVLIFAAFVYHPDWIRDWLRLMTHSIESIADHVPQPWGARLEIMLRELGGVIKGASQLGVKLGIRNAQRGGPLYAGEWTSSGCLGMSEKCHNLTHAPNQALPYSITSSARASRVGGTMRPSVLAVLRLITSSNFAGWMTGRSAAFSPLRMRPTYNPDNRYPSDRFGP
jgi:hypothetical protein